MINLVGSDGGVNKRDNKRNLCSGVNWTVNATAPTIDSPGLVDQLGRLIEEQQLKPGDRLPSIRELAGRFGTKVGPVRGALLEAQGRGLIKLLPRAGAFVEAPVMSEEPTTSAERLGERLRELLAAENQNLFHLLEARETLELSLIAQAARKREIEDLLSLRNILEQMASISPKQRGVEYVDLDIEFHLEIARLSGNAVMAAMLCAVMEELAPHLKELRWSPKRHSDTDKSHARLYSALVQGDELQAQKETRDHLRHAYQTLLDRVRQTPKV